MTTRSGASYQNQPEELSEMEQALKSMEQMMQQLVEDRRQREEEFASERATWQRAADDRIREMQAQTDRLMRLVHDSRPSTEPTPAKLLRAYLKLSSCRSLSKTTSRRTSSLLRGSCRRMIYHVSSGLTTLRLSSPERLSKHSPHYPRRNPRIMME